MKTCHHPFILGIIMSSVMWGSILYLYSCLSDSSLQRPFNSDMKEFTNEPEISRHSGSARLNLKSDVVLDELGIVKTADEGKIKEDGYEMHSFNTLVSSRLSYHRPIPDTRNKRCHKLDYNITLPDASIVICFYREDKSVLLRSVHSILDRTPRHLIQEIILIDDTNNDKYHKELSAAIQTISDKIKLVKLDKREGLMRARVIGARMAVGSVLIFLDSHIEVNVGWIEPLLSRIAENNTFVVAPIIDVISPDTFEYGASPLVRGGFNWGLHFKWDTIPLEYFHNKENLIRPIRSATMAGGLFAIDRQFFKRIGEYDEGMNLWGAENLEISFRVWLCGGHLEIVPCSRVGHVFRKRRPYGSAGKEDSMIHNSARLAHVWLDEYKEYFFDMNPLARNVDYGDISERLELRRNLKCKSFEWYVKNIYPEILSPFANDAIAYGVAPRKYQPWYKRKRDYVKVFQIQMKTTGLCIESESDTDKRGSSLFVSRCTGLPRQVFYLTSKNEIVLDKLLCLESNKPGPLTAKCHEMGGSQEWIVKGKESVMLYNTASGNCLATSGNKIGSYVIMAICTSDELNQWILVDL